MKGLHFKINKEKEAEGYHSSLCDGEIMVLDRYLAAVRRMIPSEERCKEFPGEAYRDMYDYSLLVKCRNDGDDSWQVMYVDEDELMEEIAYGMWDLVEVTNEA